MDKQKQLAKLQSEHDHLITELSSLEELVKEVGFEGGLETLKAAMVEIGTKDA